MLDPGDSKFPEHQPGIVLRAALIPRFGFFVAEAGPLTFSPAIEFGGSAAVWRGASVFPRWENVIFPRQARNTLGPQHKSASFTNHPRPLPHHTTHPLSP